MITAVLDTNVIVGAAIGSEQATAGRTLDAYFDGKYQLAFSPATSDELLHVLSLPMIRRRHGWSDDDILRFVLSLHVSAMIGTGRLVVSPKLTRDVTDKRRLPGYQRPATPSAVTPFSEDDNRDPPASS